MSKYFKELQVKTKLTGKGLFGEVLHAKDVLLDGIAVKDPRKLKYEDLCAARKIVADGKIIKDRYSAEQEEEGFL